MIWKICFIVSVAVFLSAISAAVILTNKEYRKRMMITPFHLFFGGVTLSSMCLFIPIYAKVFRGEDFYIWKILLLSLHNTIRLFIVDGEFTIITENIVGLETGFRNIYSLFSAVIFVIAPFLTFGVVLSFFKNISAYKNYLLSYFSEVYIFSELNEQSLELARSLKRNNKKRIIVFTDVFVKNEETSYELTESARELGAINFKKDITLINFGVHSKQKPITFFITGEDDDENIKQTLTLIAKYNDRESTSLYVFSTSINSELLLNTTLKGKMKVRRVNMVKSLISRNLYDDGAKIFENAVAYDKDEKLISAVVVGLGKHGTEMARTLPWFCQMTGYRFVMNAFDQDKKADSCFRASCPELMDQEHNGNFNNKFEARYQIDVHSKMDIETEEFWNTMKQIERVTYVFVALGDDEKNISAAVRLRSWFEKRGLHPQIDAIVYNSDKKEALTEITNYSGQPYDINFIGDMHSSYSEEVILHSEIEEIALQRHLKWGKEEEFWKYEYNYRSSIASAIHKKMRIICGIPGAEKLIKDRTEEEKKVLRNLEHSRWNAYMRADGFTCSKVRNNLAKTHPSLIPFDKLPKKEQEKDDD